MFDYHMHCKVSTDSVEEPAKMIQAAKAAGLKQICFTDHYDHHWNETDHHHLFCKEEYRSVFDDLHDPDIRVCKGMEINTSGVDRCGAFLPSADFMRRFKELGGQIVTVGSDAHDAGRVGQYCHEAAHILQDIFGYVCTFEGRKPTFHKL